MIPEAREQNPFSSIATENESGAPEKSTGIVATQVKRLFRIICQLSFSCRFIRRIIIPYRSTMKRAGQESTRIVLASWLSSLLPERKPNQLGSNLPLITRPFGNPTPGGRNGKLRLNGRMRLITG